MEEQNNRHAEDEQTRQTPPADGAPKQRLPSEDPAIRSLEAYQKLTMLGVLAFFIVVLVYNLFVKQIQYDVYAIGLGYVAVESRMRANIFGEKKRSMVSILSMIGAILSLAAHISLTFPR